MKILLISDIHANIEAMTAIEEDYDAMLCMGDLVDYGPSPKEYLAFLKERAATIVRGNQDNAVAFHEDCRCHGDYKPLSVATRQLMWELLDDVEIEFLRKLPLTDYVSLGGARFFLCHAAPSNPLFQYLPADSPDEVWKEEIKNINADYILLGHTHEPFQKRIGNRWVINPGSVGQPKGDGPLASYAVWQDGEVALKKVPYDVERTIAKIKQTGLAPQIKAGLRHILRFGSLA
jgi:putative phosphoesterase